MIRKFFITIIGVVIALIVSTFYLFWNVYGGFDFVWANRNLSIQPREKVEISELKKPTVKLGSKIVKIPDKEIPKSFKLTVPYTMQAPFGGNQWYVYLYNNACEEASYLMARLYKEKKTSITAKEADSTIVDMVNFEKKLFGGHIDLTIGELAEFIEEYDGYKPVVKYNISVDDIKQEIAAGRPVIVPAAGRMLKNPHFRGIGPYYHMLLITGYTPTTFITNDPGTRVGKDYVYGRDILMNAIHDFKKKNIEDNRGVMLVLK
ncbi:MAG TPA: C39 family peptidase [Ignavibacteria bacterium]|nr:C39 family peptidase [Ignavibacteria bacterium]